MWVKYRVNQAAGRGEWEFADVPLMTEGIQSGDLIREIEMYLEWQGHMDTYHDLYRGMDIGIINNPPVDVLLKKLQGIEEEIEKMEHQRDGYQVLLDKLKEKE